jgi:uncharacterized protein YukE
MNHHMPQTDLSIVPDAVRLTARRIDGLSHESKALVASNELFTTDQVGHPELADALQGFASEWNQQVRSSSEHFADIASRLAETTESYQRADGEIAAALAPSSQPDGPS